MSFPPESLQPLLASIAKLLSESSTTVSIAESTTGGLISASLLSVEGAASWYKGGTVLYTLEARTEFSGWSEKDTAEYRGPNEDVASKLAVGVQERLRSTYCIGEAGVAGPISRVRSLPPGLTCLAIARENGPPITKTIMTGSRDRLLNMYAFTEEALKLFEEVLINTQKGKL